MSAWAQRCGRSVIMLFEHGFAMQNQYDGQKIACQRFQLLIVCKHPCWQVALLLFPCRWEYYVTNWDNLLWATQTLVGLSTRDPTMTAAARNYIDRWRFGEVVLGLSISLVTAS